MLPENNNLKMTTHFGETSASAIHFERSIDNDGDWNNFLILRRHLPFETDNWTDSDNMEVCSVKTQGTVICSAMSDDYDETQLKKRQRLHMSKYILLIDFLEDLDSDWEITTEYDYHNSVNESTGNFKHMLERSEEINNDILSDIAMVPSDIEQECVLQFKRHADLLFTRCSRTLDYLETLRTDDWEIATLSDVNLNESSVQLETKSDHMFHSAISSGFEISWQKSGEKIAELPKTVGFARNLNEEFQRVSVVKDDLIIPSSSIEDEKDNEDEPPLSSRESPKKDEFDSTTSKISILIPSISCSTMSGDSSKITANLQGTLLVNSEKEIKQKEDCCEQIAFRNDENMIDHKVIATGAENISPDDPLGLQHLTWQESDSPSGASESAATTQWNVVDNEPTSGVFALQPITEGMRYYRPPNRKLIQQLASSPVPTMSQLENHGFAANTAATSEACTQGSEIIAQMVNAPQKTNCTVSSFENDQENQTVDCGFQVRCESFARQLSTSQHDRAVSCFITPVQQSQTNEPVTSKRKSALKPASSGKPPSTTIKEKSTSKRKLSAETPPTSTKRVQFNLMPKERSEKSKLIGANALLRRTTHYNVNKPSVTANGQYDPYDASHIEDDGDSTFENFFSKPQSTTEVLAPKKATKAKKKKKSTAQNLSSDSIESNIISILQNTLSSFDDTSCKNKNKIVKNRINNMSKKRLTRIVETSVQDAMKAILKSRRRRGFRRSPPTRKIVLKKVFVPKRKPSEDKAVQVVFTEDRSTNTQQIPVEPDQDASIDKTEQENLRKTNAMIMRQRRTTAKKDFSDKTAANTAKDLLNVKQLNNNQPSVKKPQRNTRTYTKHNVADPVSLNPNPDDRQQAFVRYTDFTENKSTNTLQIPVKPDQDVSIDKKEQENLRNTNAMIMRQRRTTAKKDFSDKTAANTAKDLLNVKQLNNNQPSVKKPQRNTRTYTKPNVADPVLFNPNPDDRQQAFVRYTDFTEDKSTNTLQIPVKPDQDASIDKKEQENLKNTNAKIKRRRRTKAKKDFSDKTAANISKDLLNVEQPNNNQPSVKISRRNARTYTKHNVADPVSFKPNPDDRQQEFVRYKQTIMPQYMHRINERDVHQRKKIRVSNELPNMTRLELKPTKGCYRSPQCFNTQPSNDSNASSSIRQSGTIYCPHATIVCCGNDNDNTFCRRIDELRLCGMHSYNSDNQISPSSHALHERIHWPERQLHGTRLSPDNMFSASETSSSEDLPDFDRTPLFDDVLKPVVGPPINLEHYPEAYAEYIETHLSEQLKSGTLKTLPELYGNEAQTVWASDVNLWFWPDDIEELVDSGMNMSDPIDNYSSANIDDESAPDHNTTHVQCQMYRYFCSSIRGSQEPSRFSPGLSPISYD